MEMMFGCEKREKATAHREEIEPEAVSWDPPSSGSGRRVASSPGCPSTASKEHALSFPFMSRNRKKSDGAQSGEYRELSDACHRRRLRGK
jgi:hypothetical protein